MVKNSYANQCSNDLKTRPEIMKSIIVGCCVIDAY